ncbi:MAG TPA: hypothetical protein VGB82_04515 [Alphaproteobacteria bacterium]
MAHGGQHKSKDGDGPAGQSGKLPYCVELWDASGQSVERVLARAVSAELARAIFKAACTEHPARRITLRRGTKVISDSKDPS